MFVEGAYRDSYERNAAEGRNGNAKRRFGLDRLFSKLDETAKTEAALILLAMNACHRLVRWLALLFRVFLVFPSFVCFSVNPIYDRRNYQQTHSNPSAKTTAAKSVQGRSQSALVSTVETANEP